MRTLIALLDTVTRENHLGTRLDNIIASLEMHDMPSPKITRGTSRFSMVEWRLPDGAEFRALVQYLDETDAAFEVVHS